jgi:hypothetical protein
MYLYSSRAPQDPKESLRQETRRKGQRPARPGGVIPQERGSEDPSQLGGMSTEDSIPEGIPKEDSRAFRPAIPGGI